MQIVPIGDNLHELSNSVYWEKNTIYITNLSFAELAQRVVKVNKTICYKVVLDIRQFKGGPQIRPDP